MNFAINHYATYLLVLLRMAAFIGASPVLSLQSWPVYGKIGLAGFVALVVAPGLTAAVPSPFDDPGGYVVDALKETVVGMLMGFVATLMFAAVDVAGQLFDIQIGYSSATVFDPQSGVSTGLSSSLLSLLFTLYFLGVGGLDGMVLAMMHSYEFVGLGQFVFPANTWKFLLSAMGMMMSIGLQFAAPLLAALLLTDVTFAFLSRAVPQMNVFVVEFPAKLFVGLALFAIAMPGTVYLFSQLFGALFNELNTLLQWLRG
ncbi:flagellar biosynthetic protein FliR [Alicyclobacillus cycloheptanicus]|nr:flagellar biosynthetic protein FliR [Alicyclobacillus cycloheptanicus]